MIPPQQQQTGPMHPPQHMPVPQPQAMMQPQQQPGAGYGAGAAQPWQAGPYQQNPYGGQMPAAMPAGAPDPGM